MSAILRRVSQENVEIVRRGLEAFNSGDWEASMSELHERAVWVPSPAFPDTAPRHGRETIRRFWEELDAAMGGFQAAVDDVIDAGDGHVVALVRIGGIGRGSGADVWREIAQVFTLREGKVVSVVGYDKREHALSAFGLTQP